MSKREPLRLGGAIDRLSRISLALGKPIRRSTGSTKLNPLPHAGTISVYLLAVVVVTGLYITLFFEFGFEATYRSVDKINDHPIQTVARAIHRYSSGALVVTVFVHAWRVFVAKRFTGLQRRWRWITGMVSLVLVWLAGVTGYWLAWDERAGALNEVMINLFGGTRRGASFAIGSILGSDVGTGWTVVLTIWFIHLGLTVAIVYFTYRHLRRSRLPWAPPRHWILLISGALLLASLLAPVGMLGTIEPDRLVSSMPVDPFFLFLLPLLLGDGAWLIIGVAVAMAVVATLLPKLITRQDPEPVAIDPDACTGCDLCVIDCPYLALSLVPGDDTERGIALVDPDLCVSCGICLGSCSFGAMSLPGFEPLAQVEVAHKKVVLACERHMIAAPEHDESSQVFVEVSCTGMVHHSVVADLKAKGATSVQIVGCGPSDCSYGIGNLLTSERIDGTRAPHVPRRLAGATKVDFVSPGDIDSAVASPGKRPEADGSEVPVSNPALNRAGIVVLASIALIAAATRLPFSPASDEAMLRVQLSHIPGLTLVGQTQGTGALEQIEIAVDGVSTVAELDLSGDSYVALVDLDLDLAPHEVEIWLTTSESDQRISVLSETVVPQAGDRIVREIVDIPEPPGVAEGKSVFNSRSQGACNVCHSVDAGEVLVGPSLAGIGTNGANRIVGLSAPDYIRQSILAPNAFVVEGFRADQMLDIYQDRLSEEELEALVTYLSSLTKEEE